MAPLMAQGVMVCFTEAVWANGEACGRRQDGLCNLLIERGLKNSILIHLTIYIKYF